MNIIDLKDKTSFQAISELHKALSSLSGDTFSTSCNDSLVKLNVEKFLKKQEITFESEESDKGTFTINFSVSKDQKDRLTAKEEEVKQVEKMMPPDMGLPNTLILFNGSSFDSRNLTLSNYHIKSILNELVISNLNVDIIIFMKDHVKFLNENHEFNEFIVRLCDKNIKLIADEPSVSFFAVKINESTCIRLLPTGKILKLITETNTNVIQF